MRSLTRITNSQRAALALTGVARSTWHYRPHPRGHVSAPIPQAERAYTSRITDTDRTEIQARILAGWDRQLSVDHSSAAAWDAGVMLGSRRTWWRIAKDLTDWPSRPVVPSRQRTRASRIAPVVIATRAGQAWSWDITDLLTPWRGITLKGYKITDLVSRKTVGYRVEERESDQLAVEMFREATKEYGAPEVVHADSGPAMRSHALRDFLANEHGVRMSHNRP